jgi:hypothetical protein
MGTCQADNAFACCRASAQPVFLPCVSYFLRPPLPHIVTIQQSAAIRPKATIGCEDRSQNLYDAWFLLGTVASRLHSHFNRPSRALKNVMSFERYRDLSGDLSLKYGNILMRTFRQYYGPAFAKRCGDNERLSDVLRIIDEGSLSELIKDDEAGRLEQVSRTIT